MNALDLLNQVRAAGVRVSVEADRLKLDAPAGVLTEQLRADLAAAKAEILVLLSLRPRAGSAAAPIVVYACKLTECPFDDCGGRISCKKDQCYCDRCKCWFLLKEVEVGTNMAAR